uniref:Uncharacterized protein n=1 Tax=Rhipicephalus microplus TaxID=6941 RepID=A0A6G5AFM6_RHIMP
MLGHSLFPSTPSSFPPIASSSRNPWTLAPCAPSWSQTSTSARMSLPWMCGSSLTTVRLSMRTTLLWARQVTTCATSSRAAGRSSPPEPSGPSHVLCSTATRHPSQGFRRTITTPHDMLAFLYAPHFLLHAYTKYIYIVLYLYSFYFNTVS